MIRKRTNNETQSTEEKPIYVDKPIPRSGPISRFKTYREEAIYVLDILKKQGVNIYEEGRYGGMYLKTKEQREVPSLLLNENNTNNTDNNKIPISSLEEFFKN